MKHNPYTILGVSQAASKAEINKAVAVAMKSKQYPVDVIAKAQKILISSEERIIADYLRPILPPIKRFKYSNLSELGEPLPNLVVLPEFDGLEEALNQATQEECREREPLAIPLSELFNEGATAYRDGGYLLAIKSLEEYCKNCIDKNSKDYIQAQIWLVKAYHINGQPQQAIALCQMLVNHSDTKIQAWANKNLHMLSKDASHV